MENRTRDVENVQLNGLLLGIIISIILTGLYIAGIHYDILNDKVIKIFSVFGFIMITVFGLFIVLLLTDKED